MGRQNSQISFFPDGQATAAMQAQATAAAAAAAAAAAQDNKTANSELLESLVAEGYAREQVLTAMLENAGDPARTRAYLTKA